MRSGTFEKVYDTSVIVLALVSVGLAIVDLTRGLSLIWSLVDTCIYWMFLLDYAIRLFISSDKKKFVKNNIPDLIAIIPFNSAFRAFRSFRLLKVSKLSKLTKLSKFARVGSVSARGLKKAKSFFDTNGLKYVILITAAAILAGAVGMMMTEEMAFSDALWWSFVTATTVGYGDLSPATNVGRVIAALLMLVGIGLIGSLTSTITSFFLQEKSEGEDRASSEKVQLVLSMYDTLLDTLNDSERKEFLDVIRHQESEDGHV